MPTWRLRDFRDDDLDRAIQIWDQSRQTDDAPSVFPISEVMAVARTGGSAVVAVVGDDMVGMAVAQTRGEGAWITLLALAGTWRDRGIGSALIAELERRLRAHGVRRIGALLAPGATGTGRSSTRRPAPEPARAHRAVGPRIPTATPPGHLRRGRYAVRGARRVCRGR